MHSTTKEFDKAQAYMLKLTTDIVQLSYELGDYTRSGMAVFEAIEYEFDQTFETVLVEIRWGMGRVMGRGRTHYSMSPVFSEGFQEMKDRMTALFRSAGKELVDYEPVHITQSDCWGMILRFRA